MPDQDVELEAVAAVVRGTDPDATRQAIGWVLRDTIDQLLDGQHTGRYRWEQLIKTEKTHAGTLSSLKAKPMDLSLRELMDGLLSRARHQPSLRVAFEALTPKEG